MQQKQSKAGKDGFLYMDTNALVINNKNEQEKESSSSAPLRHLPQIRQLASKLISNPEFPDVLRDAAPYFSPPMRKTVVKLAAMGQFMNNVSSSDFEASSTEPRPMSEAFNTLKKYVPMDKRTGIENMMELVHGIRAKFAPREASTPLEGIIDKLTRINELNKIASSARTMKSLANVVSQIKDSRENTSDGGGLNPETLVQLIGGMLGHDKAAQLKDMLATFQAAN